MPSAERVMRPAASRAVKARLTPVAEHSSSSASCLMLERTAPHRRWRCSSSASMKRAPRLSGGSASREGRRIALFQLPGWMFMLAPC